MPLLRVLRILVPVLVTAVALVVVPAPAQAGDTAPRAQQKGRWLVDGRDRVLVMHGVNMVYKRPPYAADATGFGADDARFLARNGFTSVRLGLTWKGVEPEPGTYDDAYLARVRRTVRVLERHGVRTLLDFHQDLYNERFQGEGAPDWAVQDDGLPAEPQAGFPANYFGMPALWRAFDHFWANDPGPGDVGLQVRYARAWKHVAAFMAGTPGVFGIDLLNEPFPGTPYASCLQPAGCPAFDAQLTEFAERSVRAIRTVDRRTMVFYEPHLFFNVGVPTYVAPKGRRLGFSFHNYCGVSAVAGEYTGCDAMDPLVYDNAEAQYQTHGDLPMLTEFGATTDADTLRSVVDLAMSHMLSWQYWAYCGCDDPTTTGPGTEQALVFDPAEPPRGKNVDKAKLRLLAVPHPMRVSGTPVSYAFDRDTRTFTFSYRAARAGRTPGRFHAGSRTTVSVPRIAYRHGYRTHVTGARVLSDRNATTLRLALERGVRTVTVRLVKRPA